jgi:hypothetical protein
MVENMDILKFLTIFLLLTIPAWAVEGEILKVNLPTDQVATTQELGTLNVEVQALGPEGKVIGRAESVVGLKETPIYIAASKGLKKVTVIWQGP